MGNGSSDITHSNLPKGLAITKHTKINQEIRKLDLATEKYLKNFKKV